MGHTILSSLLRKLLRFATAFQVTGWRAPCGGHGARSTAGSAPSQLKLRKDHHMLSNPLPGATSVDAAGIEFIKSFEQLRLTVYDDGAGNNTVGWGHRTSLKIGTKISQTKAETLLKMDLSRATQCVNRAVKRPLTQGQMNALVSFVFNVGCRAFRNSKMLWFIEHGDMPAAAAQFPLWCHADGKVLHGLIERRQAEQQMFRRIEN